MRLPSDPSEWHDGHLQRAVAERDAAFARYEAKVDFEDRSKSDHLYDIYFKKDERVDQIMLALYGRKTL